MLEDLGVFFKRLILKNDDDLKKQVKKNSTQPSITQPSPDNHGIELENPKNVDEAAAEANRDVPALLKIYPNRKKSVRNKISKKWMKLIQILD